MPTAQIVINNAMRKLGLVDPSGTPGASDSVACLAELNNMWESWSIDEGLVFAILAYQYPLVAYQQSYALGPTGADWTIPQVPSRVYGAAVVSAVSFAATTTSTSQTIAVANTAGLYVGMRVMGAGIVLNSTILAVTSNTSIKISYVAIASASVTLVATGLNRNELTMVNSERYLNHNDLGATATTPEEIYPRFNQDSNGDIRIYVWPVVNETQASYMELELAVPFTKWTLTTPYSIPPGYQDTIEWALAFRMLPTFGVAVQQQVAAVVQAEGVKAEARLRKANAINRQLPDTAVMVPSEQAKPAPQGQ